MVVTNPKCVLGSDECFPCCKHSKRGVWRYCFDVRCLLVAAVASVCVFLTWWTFSGPPRSFMGGIRRVRNSIHPCERLVVVTTTDRAYDMAEILEEQNDWTFRHGLVYERFRIPDHPDRHAAWTKLDVMLNALNVDRFKNASGLVWIDDDLIPTNKALSLCDVIPWEFWASQKKHVLLQRDIDENQPLNTGFLVVKRSDEGRYFLEVLRNSAKSELGDQFRYGPNWEQSALNSIYRMKHPPEEYVQALEVLSVVDYGAIQRFVRHYALDPSQFWTGDTLFAHVSGMATPVKKWVARRVIALAQRWPRVDLDEYAHIFSQLGAGWIHRGGQELRQKAQSCTTSKCWHDLLQTY